MHIDPDPIDEFASAVRAAATTYLDADEFEAVADSRVTLIAACADLLTYAGVPERLTKRIVAAAHDAGIRHPIDALRDLSGEPARTRAQAVRDAVASVCHGDERHEDHLARCVPLLQWADRVAEGGTP